jgi:hypothetical protein
MLQVRHITYITRESRERERDRDRERERGGEGEKGEFLKELWKNLPVILQSPSLSPLSLSSLLYATSKTYHIQP